MGFFDSGSDQADSYEQFQNPENHHESKFSHEMLAGAASFAAARAYEKHVEANGQPANHAMAKELLAGFAGAFIDKEVESRGLDFVDKEKAKYHARQHVEDLDQGQLGY